MDLQEYLINESISVVQFSVKCDVSVASLYKYLRGEIPSRRNAYKIIRASDGKIDIKKLRGSK